MPVRPPLRVPVVAAVYLAAAWFVYGWTLDAPFLLDDQQAIQFNEAIRTIWPPWVALDPPAADVSFARRPVTNLTMALNYAIGDLQVEGYRLFNLVLHAVNSLLLFLLAGRLLSLRAGLSPSLAWWSAFFAGLVWAVHPLATSAVHYVIQRMELLVASGFLFMCWAQCRALGARHPRRWLALAVFACLLGMGSKETMFLAPVLAVLLDRCTTAWSWREQWRNRGFYYALLAATWIWPASRLMVFSADGVFGADLQFRWQYFLTVAEGVVRHVTLLFWPRGQVFDYGTRLVGGLGEVAPQFYLVLLATGLVLWGLHRRSVAAWAGAAAFAIMLPSWINLVPGQPVSEHRFYLPAGLVIGLVCGSLGVLTARHGALRRPIAVAACAAIIALALTGRQRAELYASPVALLEADIAAWPRSDRSHMNLGLVLEVQEDYAGAARQYELAMGTRERANWRPLVALARLRIRSGDSDSAVALTSEAFRRVFSVEQAPDLPQLVNNVVSSFRSAGRLDAALPLLRAAEATGMHRRLLAEQIRIVTAETAGLEGVAGDFQQNAESDPLTRLNFAIALAREGQAGEAVALLDRMIAEAPPGSEPLKIADVYALKGAMSTSDPAGARAALEEALRLNPSHSEALNNFAWLLATSTDEAIYDPPRALELARKAVRLRSDETNFQGTLAVALAAAGYEQEAEVALSEAQRLGRINGNSNPELPDLVREAGDRAVKDR